MRTEKFDIFLSKERHEVCKSNHTTKSMHFITHLIPPNTHNKILNIGAGEGRETYILHQLGYAPIGITQGINNLKYALNNYPNLDISIMDMHDLQFPSNFFDAIYIHHAFEHSLAPYIQLVEMYCVLRNKGLVWIGLPHYKEQQDKDFNPKINIINEHHTNMISPLLYKHLFNLLFDIKYEFHNNLMVNNKLLSDNSESSIYFDHSYLLEKKSLSHLNPEVQRLVIKRYEKFG